MPGDTPVWQQRTGASTAPDLAELGESTQDDEPLVLVDIAGSIAHALGLLEAGLIEETEAAELVEGLQTLAAQAESGELALDPVLEDVHMNVETQLGELVGDVAGKLHTGRSRNDQVALDLVLHTRTGLVGLASELLTLAGTLAEQANAHVQTPWVAKTHGQPAQPATLGFLLHAHAQRFQDLASDALSLFEAIDESPLGSGAVAGSTLPLDPAFTADLLGLEPPKNALLATSSRAGGLKATQLAGTVGLAAASLATDLISLAHANQATFPQAYTTGSSLMPHKRNPDALELVRGHGKALSAPQAQLASTLAGLGLGYDRDLQLTKPPLTEALGTATGILGVLDGVVEGTAFDAEALAAELDQPGILATDAVEALVLEGVPFRTAYGALAQAFASVEQGAELEPALEATELTPDQVEIALGTLDGDPSPRLTAGAPGTTETQLEAFEGTQATLADRLTEAQALAGKPYGLLDAPVKQLLAAAIEGGR